MLIDNKLLCLPISINISEPLINLMNLEQQQEMCYSDLMPIIMLSNLNGIFK